MSDDLIKGHGFQGQSIEYCDLCGLPSIARIHHFEFMPPIPVSKQHESSDYLTHIPTDDGGILQRVIVWELSPECKADLVKSITEAVINSIRVSGLQDSLNPASQKANPLEPSLP